MMTRIFFPPSVRRCSNISVRPHIGWEVTDHAETSSRPQNWYVNEMDLFKMPLQRPIATQINNRSIWDVIDIRRHLATLPRIV